MIWRLSSRSTAGNRLPTMQPGLRRLFCFTTHRWIHVSPGGWPACEEVLKANHVNYTAYVYEGVNHGFHNDTTPRYDQAAAKLAWQRTLDFLNKYLRG